MEQTGIVQWFATLGVGGIVAGFMFLFYRRDMKQFAEMWKEQAERNQEVIKQVLDVVRDNTTALTKVVSVVDSLHRRLDAGPPYPYRQDEDKRRELERQQRERNR